MIEVVRTARLSKSLLATVRARCRMSDSRFGKNGPGVSSRNRGEVHLYTLSLSKGISRSLIRFSSGRTKEDVVETLGERF